MCSIRTTDMLRCLIIEAAVLKLMFLVFILKQKDDFVKSAPTLQHAFSLPDLPGLPSFCGSTQLSGGGALS